VIQRRLLGYDLFLLDSDLRIFLGHERSQFLRAMFQSVEALEEFIIGGGTSLIHAHIYAASRRKVSPTTKEYPFFF
jgi:hypothetical protein